MDETTFNIRKVLVLGHELISNFDAEAYLYEGMFRKFYGFYRNFEQYIIYADAYVYDLSLDVYPVRIYTITVGVRADPKDIQEMKYYTERMIMTPLNGVY